MPYDITLCYISLITSRLNTLFPMLCRETCSALDGSQCSNGWLQTS